MSVEITAKIICDNCGDAVIGDVQTTTAQGQTAYWSAKRKAKQMQWMMLTRYGTARHLCQPCADGQTSSNARTERPAHSGDQQPETL
jgi:hypothetical protein